MRKREIETTYCWQVNERDKLKERRSVRAWRYGTK